MEVSKNDEEKSESFSNENIDLSAGSKGLWTKEVN